MRARLAMIFFLSRVQNNNDFEAIAFRKPTGNPTQQATFVSRASASTNALRVVSTKTIIIHVSDGPIYDMYIT